MIFQSYIDQDCPHVMDCQIEPLIKQDKIQCITLLISRAFLFGEQNHVVPDADKLLDCVVLEISNRSISFCLFLKVSTIFKLYRIP